MNVHRGLLTRDLSFPVNPWLVLLALALCAGWLMPTHTIPWRSYHSEMAMVAAALPIALWAPLRSRRAVAVPWIAWVVLAVALVPWLQWSAGRIDYVGDAWLRFAYLLAFALAIVTGARFEQVEPRRLAPVLFGAFAVAGVVSTGLAMYQLLRLTGLGLWTLEFPYSLGPRPFANLGQSNHLATLLVWSLLAFWWLYLRGHVRGTVAVFGAAFVLVGIASTQARTAWLELAVVALAAAFWRAPMATRRCLPGLAFLAVFFVALVVVWGPVTQVVEFGNARSFGDGDLASPGLRPAIWRMFIDAVGHEPWFGWGWGQLSVANTALVLDHPPMGYSSVSSHNLLLDLAVQQGIPLTVFFVGALAAWYLVALRRVRSDEDILLLAAITVLLVHAMLEFPQNYVYFLVPLGLMVGLLHARDGTRTSTQLPRWSVFAVALGATLIAGWMAVEYRMAEKSLEQVRMERNNVGFARGSVAPDLKMLTQLREFLAFLRLRYAEPAAPGQLEAMRRLVQHYPSDGNFLVLAVAEARNGHPDRAQDALARMCRMVPAFRCTAALTTWKAVAAESPALALVALPR
jgi:O-antigen ligase